MSNSSWIEIYTSPDGQTFSGYLSLPPTGSGPALVILQEIWGVNDHIQAVADQYAADGYVVLAPDVYWRQQYRTNLTYDQSGTDQARQLMMALDRDQATEDLMLALEYLRQQATVTGPVGVVGFCMGGQLAFRLAANSTVDAAVCYYGGGIEQQLHLADDIRAPILFHHASLDSMISQDAVNNIRTAMASHQGSVFFDYLDTDHGFNCWGRPMYNQQASALAHGRTLQFLAEQLV
ncbi:dienelactone hydrolase family protein [Oceanobacter mangrovi]|uniref:dienelactone hydrolase family protein n=1 Tax=Oceanobacter mangrovi TaxID=2862510 RepID=UPI001C8ED496|nr:dienelactone hydrolase family protein [Oceanobacter mangrovi]